MTDFRHYLYNRAAEIAKNLTAITDLGPDGYMLFFDRNDNSDQENEGYIEFLIKEIAAISDYAIHFKVAKGPTHYTLTISWDKQPDDSHKVKSNKWTVYPVKEVSEGTNAVPFRYSN